MIQIPIQVNSFNIAQNWKKGPKSQNDLNRSRAYEKDGQIRSVSPLARNTKTFTTSTSGQIVVLMGIVRKNELGEGFIADFLEFQAILRKGIAAPISFYS